ncbi:MAG: hypothetical protein WAL70_05425 [Aeromicrobium sp.]
MLRTPRSSIPIPVLGLLVVALAFALAACGGDDPSSDTDGSSSSGTTQLPDAEASNPSKSCQAVVGSGAIEDIQAVFDKYKNNSKPLTTADAKTMRDALDRLAKAGDNASPKVREDVVKLVADGGSLIDSRAGLPGTGKVASPEKIQSELDALCS